MQVLRSEQNIINLEKAIITGITLRSKTINGYHIGGIPINRFLTDIMFISTDGKNIIILRQFIAVAPSVGARVNALPDGCRRVIINNMAYYEFEGNLFKAIGDRSGEYCT